MGERWGVPELARLSERLVPTLLIAQLCVIGAGERPGGAITTLNLVLLVLWLATGITIMVRIWVLRGRLFPDTAAARKAGAANGLTTRLREGGYVAPEERGRAGRVVWWSLSVTVIACWIEGMFLGANMENLHRDGWPLGSWGIVSAVCIVAGLAAYGFRLAESVRWRRIAADPHQVTAPPAA